MIDLTALGELVPEPREVVPPNDAPDTIEGWKALADDLLGNQCCALHRNAAISSRYAWIHRARPASFKWAAMAAVASHHVRIALYPLRYHTDHHGNPVRSVGHRHQLLAADVDTIRSTNNAIYDDIFWAHLAYATAGDGIDRLRALLGPEPHYAPILAGFEVIDQGCRVLENPGVSDAARRAANELIWAGNVQVLEHEQRAVVQPNFDRLSCAFARIISLGSATTFEVHGLREEMRYFTSFYSYSLTRGIPYSLRARGFPRLTCYDDRWRWLAMSVVPHFRRFDTNAQSLDIIIGRIFAMSRAYAATPCLPPRWSVDGPHAPNA